MLPSQANQDPQQQPNPADQAQGSLPGRAIRNYGGEILIAGILLGLLTLMVAPRLSSATNNEREQLLDTDLHNLRTQILAYQAQHNNTPPGFPQGNTMLIPTNEVFISQMTLYTNDQGHTSSKPSSEFRFGPYIEQVPPNPFNKNSRIRFVDFYDAFPTEADGPEGWVYQPLTGMFTANTPGTDIQGRRYFDY